ncbi:MAG TPA: MerR family transcriptional regulator [Nitrolancea sp.]|nr:MerR family transcriptional regulator [Nitrolancea sp.]
MRVGELAKRTGLTVRTLRYYDEIGLLSPPRLPGSDYRQYGDAEISRLQQIASLRQLGFSLDEIREILTRPETSVRQVIELHLTRLNEQIALMEQLRARLTAIERDLQANGSVTAEEFLNTMEVMNHMSKYYTPEQQAMLKARAEELGQEHIREVEAEWPQLIAKVQAEYDAGTDPADPKVQALARRWMELVHEFTGGDPGITKSLQRAWQEETDFHGIETGPVRVLMGYVTKAIEAGKSK